MLKIEKAALIYLEYKTTYSLIMDNAIHIMHFTLRWAKVCIREIWLHLYAYCCATGWLECEPSRSLHSVQYLSTQLLYVKLSWEVIVLWELGLYTSYIYNIATSLGDTIGKNKPPCPQKRIELLWVELESVK